MRRPARGGEVPPLPSPAAEEFRGTLPGLSPTRARSLAAAGISGIEDLLWWLPLRYEDRRHPAPIGGVQADQTVLVKGRILGIRSRRARRRGMSITDAIVSDGTGNLHVIWFNQPWMDRSFPEGSDVFLYGRVSLFSTRAGLRLQLDNPDVEKVPVAGAEALHLDRVVPIYRRAGAINSRVLRGLIERALEQDLAAEPLPAQLLAAEGLPPLDGAFRALHFPEEPPCAGGPGDTVAPARRRLVFEEFLGLQCILQGERVLRTAREGVAIPRSGEAGDLLRGLLPFSLTGAQRRAFREIVADMASPSPMYRLLQGDVGSGKTAVAFLAMAWAAHAGFQAAFLAPTEILAQQQARSLREMVAPAGMEVALLTAAVRAKERRNILSSLGSGTLKLAVGTHSLFQDDVAFDALGLVVIDEQHRFGVAQRARMVAKGRDPNVLVMTATPIPRSLALTLYGDLDLSVLDELPPGRRPVVTRVRGEEDRPRVEAFLREEMDAGRQVFVVYPLVEESEESDTRAALQAYERLSEGPFRGYPAVLLHGRMKASEKERAMAEIREGRARLLVTTTVVEVGVDLPEATVMVVEHAERFGLAQLHQLRGRVGRSVEKGWCILMRSPGADGHSLERLSVLERTRDGFEIAEADLSLRGAGDPGGLRQWGGGGLRVASPARDLAVLERAKHWAKLLTEGAVEWRTGERERFEAWRERWRERVGSWGRIG